MRRKLSMLLLLSGCLPTPDFTVADGSLGDADAEPVDAAQDTDASACRPPYVFVGYSAPDKEHALEMYSVDPFRFCETLDIPNGITTPSRILGVMEEDVLFISNQNEVQGVRFSERQPGFREPMSVAGVQHDFLIKTEDGRRAYAFPRLELRGEEVRVSSIRVFHTNGDQEFLMIPEDLIPSEATSLASDPRDRTRLVISKRLDRRLQVHSLLTGDITQEVPFLGAEPSEPLIYVRSGFYEQELVLAGFESVAVRGGTETYFYIGNEEGLRRVPVCRPCERLISFRIHPTDNEKLLLMCGTTNNDPNTLLVQDMTGQTCDVLLEFGSKDDFRMVGFGISIP